MITDKKTLYLYLDADKFALGRKRMLPTPIDTIWRYERNLRYYEYFKNTRRKLLRLIYGWLLSRKGERLGFSISANVFGPGLRINHSGLLIVNAQARIGKWCDIHQGVNIGDNGIYNEDGTINHAVPIVGDYVFIGPGAKLFGDCHIGNEVRIGANAVVCKDVEDGYIVFGNPQVSKPSNKKHLSIANKQMEEYFLLKYPQYRGLI